MLRSRIAPSLHLTTALVLLFRVAATAESVPEVYTDPRDDPVVMQGAAELRDAGKLVPSEALLAQLKNTRCKLRLPTPRTDRLSGRDIWAAARQSYLRVGWFYLCKKCDKWHLDLAGGYAITTDGAVITCHHVMLVPEKFAKGHMVAATDDGHVFPITAVLAANEKSDVSIVKVGTDIPLTPLPLSADARPGDTVYCFSDPMGFCGYFSQGIVNRFYRELPTRRDVKKGANAADQPLMLNVSTDWAPGSSGSAVLDDKGNAVGHVARILPVEEDPPPRRKKKTDKTSQDEKPAESVLGTLMVVHDAVPAQEVLALIERE